MTNTVTIVPPVDRNHNHALMQAVHSANICVFYQTPDLLHQWSENLPESLQMRWSKGCRDIDLFPADVAADMERAKQEVMTTGKTLSLEVQFMQGDEPLWGKFSIDCQYDKDRTLIGVITTGINVSELRRREQVLKILLREVSHRSKNLLAIMQSIAMQTARFSGSVSEFLKKFQGRIQSLSHSQDLITDSNWRGALFQDLVLSQANGYVGNNDRNFVLEGANPYLFPTAALHIGLAVHELIINSVSFGALATETGTVSLDCSVIDRPESEKHIRICWKEDFPVTDEEDQDLKSRFGSTVLERIVPMSVSGVATYEINRGHVSYCLTMPATQFDL